MPFLKVTPRHLTVYTLVACTVILFLQNGIHITNSLSHPFFFQRNHCVSQCKSDPFKRPGTLYLGSEVSDTRWIPFPPNGINDVRSLKSINRESTIPEAFSLQSDACPQYMKRLSQNDTSSMDWILNKTILFIGSSHDRNNIRNFCKETYGKYSTIGDHAAGFCHLQRYNFTMALWFMYGAIDSDDYDWFEPSEARPLTFENRIKDIMIPWSNREGLHAPNLVIATSLFWDDKFLKQLAVHSNRAKGHEALTYSELAWHRFRIHSLVAFTRSLFGDDIPIMMRTRHLRNSSESNRILRIYQLDQNLRHVSQELGLELFTWGDLLEGYTDFADGDQHYNHGPVTWLFGDMVLFYLQQATTRGCWFCKGS